jgi:hypothetical protein
MATHVLRGLGAVVTIDDKTYNIAPGEIPESTPKAVIDELRRRGALRMEGPNAEPAEAGTGVTGSEGLPGDVPDVTTADVADIAVYIDDNNLNASQTVALAGGTVEGARKVIEAEQVASGGDGRKSVIEPLTKIAEGG